MAQRFRHEIKLARKVSHRNVCRIHEYGEDGGMRYISMEFVEGVDLRQLARERGGLIPIEEAFDLAIQAGRGAAGHPRRRASSTGTSRCRTSCETAEASSG